MRARIVAAQTGWEFATLLRNGEQLLISFGLPLLMLVAFFRLQMPAMPTGSDAVAGVMAMAVASSAFTSQAIQLGFDRQYGVLRMLSTTPLGSAGLLAGKAGAVGLVLILQFGVLFGAGRALGWEGAAVTGLAFAALFMLAGSGAFVALAVAFGGSLRAQAVIALANLLWVLMVFAGGALFVLPKGSWLAWLPPGALGNGLRAALAGYLDMGALGVLALWLVLLGLLAARLLKWD